ncbi:hypothetical protein Tco_0004856 [Tanacetum coccineum]
MIVLFKREVVEDAGKVRDFRRLSSELREDVRRRDVYVFKLRASRSCDDALGTIEMLSRMHLDDMEKAARLLLMDAANSSKWEKMMILYWHRSMVKDYILAGETTRVCEEVANVVQERAHFLEELDSLPSRLVPEKTSEF